MKPDGGAVIGLASAQIAERMEVMWQPQFSHEDRGSAGEMASAWVSRQRAHDTARALLAAFAARHWDVRPAECRAQAGQIVHPPSGRAISYLIWCDFR
jgi:CO/xanthine dehydrogenase Mo-binding subunit